MNKRIHQIISLYIQTALAGSKIFVAGCGPLSKSNYVEMLVKSGMEVHVADISTIHLQTYAKLLPKSQIHCCDLNFGLGFLCATPRNYSLIVCTKTLSYLRNFEKLMFDIRKYGQQCILSFYMHQSVMNSIRSSINAWTWPFSEDQIVSCVRGSNSDNIEGLLRFGHQPFRISSKIYNTCVDFDLIGPDKIFHPVVLQWISQELSEMYGNVVCWSDSIELMVYCC